MPLREVLQACWGRSLPPSWGSPGSPRAESANGLSPRACVLPGPACGAGPPVVGLGHTAHSLPHLTSGARVCTLDVSQVGGSVMLPREARDQVSDMLESARAEVARLTAEHARTGERLAMERMQVAVLERLLRGGALNGRQTPAAPGAGTLVKDSRVGRAYAYLRAANESRHVREILEGIGEPDTPRARNGLSTQIHRHIAKGQFFTLDEARGPRYFAAVAGDDGQGHEETPT